MGVLGNVFMQRVHVFPAAALAVVVAKQGQPCGHVKVTCAAGRWVGHDDLTLVNRLGHVFPGFRFWQIPFLRLDGVKANRRAPYIHAKPGRDFFRVAVLHHDGVKVQRRIRLQHALFVKQRQAGCSHTHHRVSLRV